MYPGHRLVIDEVGIDGSNFMRQWTAVAVTRAALKCRWLFDLAAKGELDSVTEAQLLQFAETALKELFDLTQHLVAFLKMVKATRFWICFDGFKEMMTLLRKNRVEDTSKDVKLPVQDLKKAVDLLSKARDEMFGWAQQGESAPTPQCAKVVQMVAKLLHGSESGRRLVHLLVLPLLDEFAALLPGVTIELFSTREADSATVNVCRRRDEAAARGLGAGRLGQRH